MKTIFKSVLILATILGMSMFFNACNPCGSDNPNPGKSKLNNFEPINSMKSTNQWLLSDTAQVQDTDYQILLNMEFVLVAQNGQFNLFPNAYACSPVEPGFTTNIKEIHVFSFGDDKTYTSNQKVDSLFNSFGVSMDSVNNSSGWNRTSWLILNFKDKLKETDKLQFRVVMKLEDGKEIEQATKKIEILSSK